MNTLNHKLNAFFFTVALATICTSGCSSGVVLTAVQSRDGKVLAFSDQQYGTVWVATPRGFSRSSCHDPFTLAPDGSWVAGYDDWGNHFMVNIFAADSFKERRSNISKYVPEGYFSGAVITTEAGPAIVLQPSQSGIPPLYLVYDMDKHKFLPAQTSLLVSDEVLRVEPTEENKNSRACRTFTTKAGLTLTECKGEIRLSTVEGPIIAIQKQDPWSAFGDYVARFSRYP